MSYDYEKIWQRSCKWLKGHQIIGELRLECSYLYDRYSYIEGSPDHWWVTTHVTIPCQYPLLIEGSPDHWWVTTLFISCKIFFLNWRVTRSLVSYDNSDFIPTPKAVLKGHQIIGELRLWRPAFKLSDITIEGSPDHWWVTTKMAIKTTQTTTLKGHQIIGELRQCKP